MLQWAGYHIVECEGEGESVGVVIETTCFTIIVRDCKPLAA